MPTAHHADVFDTPTEVLTETVDLVQRLARAMRVGLKATGVNVLNASGPGSEQSVRHLHFHAVPRWPDDGISTWPTGQSRHPFAATRPCDSPRRCQPASTVEVEAESANGQPMVTAL
nr:HIT domain-containing protein [Streptomyces sp.]